MVKKIKELCTKNGIAISGMEKELGFARGYIYKLNASNPSVENAKKIAKYLGVTVDELIDSE